MGFMDKAKKLAEQAQEKLEDVQKDFNAKQDSSGGNQASAAGTVEYDEHGRAKSTESTSPAATPQQGDPHSAGAPEPAAAPEPAPADEVRATPTQGDPLLEETERKSPPTPGGGLTSGDPLG